MLSILPPQTLGTAGYDDDDNDDDFLSFNCKVYILESDNIETNSQKWT